MILSTEWSYSIGQRWKPCIQFFQRKMIKIITFYFELKSINKLSNFMFFDTIKTMIINVKSFSVELISNSSRRIFSKFVFSSTVVYRFGQWFMVPWKLARHERYWPFILIILREKVHCGTRYSSWWFLSFSSIECNAHALCSYSEVQVTLH